MQIENVLVAIEIRFSEVFMKGILTAIKITETTSNTMQTTAARKLEFAATSMTPIVNL